MDGDYRDIVAAILVSGMTTHMNLPQSLSSDRAALESVRLFHSVREMLSKTKEQLGTLR
jgi:hypothetical protein